MVTIVDLSMSFIFNRHDSLRIEMSACVSTNMLKLDFAWSDSVMIKSDSSLLNLYIHFINSSECERFVLVPARRQTGPGRFPKLYGQYAHDYYCCYCYVHDFDFDSD